MENQNAKKPRASLMPNWPPSKREMVARQRAAAKAFAEYLKMVRSPEGCLLCREHAEALGDRLVYFDRWIEAAAIPDELNDPLAEAMMYENPDGGPDYFLSAGRTWLEIDPASFGGIARELVERLGPMDCPVRLFALEADPKIDGDDLAPKGFILLTKFGLWSAGLYDARGHQVAGFTEAGLPPMQGCVHDPVNWPWSREIGDGQNP